MEKGCCHVFARVTLNSTQNLIASTWESIPRRKYSTQWSLLLDQVVAFWHCNHNSLPPLLSFLTILTVCYKSFLCLFLWGILVGLIKDENVHNGNCILLWENSPPPWDSAHRNTHYTKNRKVQDLLNGHTCQRNNGPEAIRARVRLISTEESEWYSIMERE